MRAKKHYMVMSKRMNAAASPSDGKPRKVGMQDKAGGCVYVTYVLADGSVEELMSDPGAVLYF